MQSYYSGLLSGYSYQGHAAAVEVEIRSAADYPYCCATIYTYVDGGGIHAAAEYEFRSLQGGFQWLSRNLDGKPKVFGDVNLSDREKKLSIHGDGAESFVKSYLNLAYDIAVSRTTPNMPGSDLHAYLPSTGKSCSIQVKYRKKPRSIKITNTDFDFLVLITPGHDENFSVHSLDGSVEMTRSIKNWIAYIVPISVIQAGLCNRKSVKLDYTNYKMNWDLIPDFLAETTRFRGLKPTLA